MAEEEMSTGGVDFYRDTEASGTWACRRCSAYVDDLTYHARWHNGQPTIKATTEMLVGQDEEMAKLRTANAELRDLRDDHVFLIDRIRNTIRMARNGDGRMPAGYLPGSQLADVLEAILDATKKRQDPGAR